MNRRVALVVGATVAVVAAAGAGFAVGAYLGGGGTQPEDVLPDTLVVFADVDLDPAAGQKLNLVRLLGKFPDVQDDYGDRPDLRQVVVDALVDGTDLEDARVEEWVGDRVGVGLSWDDEAETLTPVAALQTTDEDEAVADLRAVLDDDQIATADGYVVVSGDLFSRLPLGGGSLLPGDLTPSFPDAAPASSIVSAAASAPLAESPSFTAVFDQLDDGVVSAYVDGDGLNRAAEELAADVGLEWRQIASDIDPGMVDGGQVGVVLRAEPSAIELLAWSSVAATAPTPAELAETLPRSTVFALEVTGGADVLANRWADLRSGLEGASLRRLERQLAELETRYGLVVPDDAQTLLGDDLVLAAEGDGLLLGVPGIGLRSVTDPAAASDLARRLQDVLDPLTGGFGLTATAVDDGVVVATSADYAATLASGEGDLGDDPTFREALPDSGDATYLLWVDLSTLGGFAQLAAPEAARAIDPLAGLGVAVTPDDDGSRIRLRLVFSDESGS